MGAFTVREWIIVGAVLTLCWLIIWTVPLRAEADPNFQELEALLLKRAEEGVKGPFPGCRPVGSVVEELRRSPAAYERLTGAARLRAIHFMQANVTAPYEPYEFVWGIAADGTTMFVLMGPVGWVCSDLTEQFPDDAKKALLKAVKGVRV